MFAPYQSTPTSSWSTHRVLWVQSKYMQLVVLGSFSLCRPCKTLVIFPECNPPLTLAVGRGSSPSEKMDGWVVFKIYLKQKLGLSPYVLLI